MFVCIATTTHGSNSLQKCYSKKHIFLKLARIVSLQNADKKLESYLKGDCLRLDFKSKLRYSQLFASPQ